METKDYSKFKLLSSNREVKDSVVKKIIASIKEWGVIPGRPVLVDKDFNVVDGQHRLEALKVLNLPVQYEVIEGDIIAKTMALNSSQAQWQLIDYIKSFADQGVDCYRKLLKFEEKYKFGITSTINLTIQGKIKSSDIRKGKIFDVQNDSDLIAEYILSLEKLPFYKTKDFIRAIIILYKKANPAQLNIIRNNILKVPRFANSSDYITAFENIINYKKRGSNIIKL